MTIRLVFILDRSSSMQGLESDVIGGFNAFIKEQKKLKDKALLTTVLFDDKYEILHNNIDIQKIKPITEKEYFVRGTTALLDAMGKAINTVDHQAKKNDKVLVVINTDGLENASREYTFDKINDLVTHLEQEHAWKFIFLGANIDSFDIGARLGTTHSFNYTNTSKGIGNMYNAVSATTATFRAAKGESIDVSLLTNLDDEEK